MKYAPLLLIALSLALSAAEPYRTWTDAKGRKVEGVLKDKNEKEAVIFLTTGKRVTLKLSNLSDADQKYVEAANLLPDPELSAKTVKIESDARKTQKDERGIEVELKKVHGRNYTVVIQWLGAKGNEVGIYKTETRQFKDDVTTNVTCAYTSKNRDGVAADYKGYAVGLKDDAGNWIVRDASQKPFIRFLDEKTTSK